MQRTITWIKNLWVEKIKPKITLKNFLLQLADVIIAICITLSVMGILPWKVLIIAAVIYVIYRIITGVMKALQGK